jgi:hypothetical protein
MRLATRPLVLAFVTAAALVAAPTALAGTYTVYGCQTPTGAPAPINGSSGWTTSIAHGAYTAGACPGTTFFGLATNTAYANGQGNFVTFTAPPGMTIQSYSIGRVARIVTNSGYYFQTLDLVSGQWRLVNGCSNPAKCSTVGNDAQLSSPSNTFNHVAEPKTTAVQLRVACGLSAGCPKVQGQGADSLWFLRSAVTLTDNTAPKILAVSGRLVEGGILGGVVPVSVSALDTGGSGVYQVEFMVDGQLIPSQTQALTPSAAHCAPPFTVPLPCPPGAGNTSVLFDTRQIADGTHSLQVLVTNAAGTVASSSPVAIVASNNGCNTTPTVAGLRMQAEFLARVAKRVKVRRHWRTVHVRVAVPQLTTHYRTRPWVHATLTWPNGAPVAGAPVCVATAIDSPGAPLIPNGTLTTGPSGGINLFPGVGPSRWIYFIYRIPGGGGAIWSAVHMSVRVPVTVHPNRHKFVNGQWMTWKGHVAGPVPSSGLNAVMEVWRGTFWENFTPGVGVHIGPSGRFTAHYHFCGSAMKRQSYKFRLFVQTQNGYAFTGNGSGPFNVTVFGGRNPNPCHLSG